MSDLLLEVVEGPQAGQQLPLTDTVEAGRSTSVTLTLEDGQVSRHHARFETRDGAVVVTDLGSMNGTYVNEQPIYTPRELRPGDRIRIGLSVIELRTADQVQAQPSAVRPVPPFAPVGAELLEPVAEPPAPPTPQDATVGLAGEPQPGDAYAALAALADTRVKRQTNIAVFAILTAAGLAVGIFFGVR